MLLWISLHLRFAGIGPLGLEKCGWLYNPRFMPQTAVSQFSTNIIFSCATLTVGNAVLQSLSKASQHTSKDSVQ